MRRIALAAVVGVGVWLAVASVAWGAPIPLCNGQANCSTGWYTSPVSVSWNLNGGTNGGGCASQTYTQDTNQSNLPQNPAVLPPWTYCIENVQGGTDTRFAFIKLEISSPTATAAPSRPADSGNWYNHPVAAAVSGSSFSGIASCTPTTYSGPSSVTATVSATCIDNAGKTVAAVSAPFAYDSTSPSLAVGAAPGDRSVVLSWQTGGDIAPTASVSVTRSRTGGHAASSHTVYSGTATSFRDTHLRNGVRYQYTVTAVDQAGNESVQSFTVIPGPRLLTPAANARLNAPPLLSWTPVIGASYYNVQLYRGGHKLLSEWPKHASLQLRRTWRFDGHRYHLRPGRYRWYVWPGFGRRSAAHYGRSVGSGTFVTVP
jgi:hypothetical protein